MLNWFNTSEVDALADWIVAEVGKRYPATGIAKSQKKTTERFIKVHDSIFNRVQSFTREQPLNIYKKARLGNRVRWALMDAGYPTAFADSLAQELVTTVAVMKAEDKKNTRRT